MATGHGWPSATRRRDLTDGGSRLRDARPMADPRSEVPAAALELALWQVGAMGLLAPLATVLYEPAAWAGSEKVRYGALAWEVEGVHESEAGPWSWITITRHAAGDYSFALPSTATAGDGSTQSVSLLAGFAQACGLDGTAAAATAIADAVELTNAYTARVRVRDSSGAMIDSPVLVVLFGGA